MCLGKLSSKSQEVVLEDTDTDVDHVREEFE